MSLVENEAYSPKHQMRLTPRYSQGRTFSSSILTSSIRRALSLSAASFYPPRAVICIAVATKSLVFGGDMPKRRLRPCYHRVVCIAHEARY
ncbi:hypothetical protein N7501_006406 [Penicillium viridicatum]|nr:hypothetical protein N7501_006406 [Penicillium viridicatum]